MFREMRRIKQLLSPQATAEVMARCTNGILACLGDEDYPYAVPLSFVCFDGKIYFHSAKEGHKIDAIARHDKVSFAVVDEDTIVAEEYTSYFRSVVVFGKARIAEGDERLAAFKALAEKYSGSLPKEVVHKKVEGCSRAAIIAIDVEQITGKEAIEYVRDKQK